MATCEFVDVIDLRLGDFACEYAAYSLAASMHMQHDLGGALSIQTEKTFQYDDDEIHRCVIVVEQDHLIQRRPCDLGPRFLERDAVFMLVAWFLRFRH